MSEEGQRERIFRRASERFGLERGGGSAVQTLVDEVERVPGAIVLNKVGVSVQEVARKLLDLTNWPNGLHAGAAAHEHSH